MMINTLERLKEALGGIYPELSGEFEEDDEFDIFYEVPLNCHRTCLAFGSLS